MEEPEKETIPSPTVSTAPSAPALDEPEKEVTPSTTPSTTPNASRLQSPMFGPQDDLQCDGFNSMSVGAIIGKKDLIVCEASASLTDAADLLTAGDRTAALVVDDAGSPLGVLTENDLLTAYLEGVHWESTVELWLHGTEARLPEDQLPARTVRTSASLGEAARLLRAQRGGRHSRHHLLVKDEDNIVRGVLSALDVARGLAGLCFELQEMVPGSHAGRREASNLVAELVGDATAEEAMKPRATLAACPLRAPLIEAFREMANANQNCVLIVDNSGNRKNVHGIITPRDLLRAFAEHMPGNTTAGRYLRGLQASMEPRTIAPSASLVDAAAVMATNSVHHLVVREPGHSQVVGILSTLDLLCFLQL